MTEPDADLVDVVVAALRAETGRQDITADTRLPTLGIDSLVATRVVVRLRVALGARVTIPLFYQDRRVADIAAVIGADR